MSTRAPVVSDLDAATDRLAATMTACIEDGDTEGFAACCSDDVVIWHNNDGLEVPLSAVVPTLSWLHRNVSGLRYEDVRRRAVAGGYVQQHVLRGTAPGGELELPACLVVAVKDGLINRIDEYVDTGSLGVLQPTAAGSA